MTAGINDILSLREFGVSIGDRVILGSVNLSISGPGITCLAGPAGTGKSTLLRTLSGLNNASPNIRTWGIADYCGVPLDQGAGPSMVMQSAKLMTSNILQNVLYELPEKGTLDLSQQRDLAVRLLMDAGLNQLTDRLYHPVRELGFGESRYLSIVRICANNPKMICLDEPTTGLSDDEAERLLAFIKRQSERRAVLITLHNQSQMIKLGGNTALLSGGEIKEFASTEDFLGRPASEEGKMFARTGSCSSPIPKGPPSDRKKTPSAVPKEAAPTDGSLSEVTSNRVQKGAPNSPYQNTGSGHYTSDSFGPRDFLWLIKGKLAGTPRPGVFHDTEFDVVALKRVGISHLISLTELPPKEPAIEVDLLTGYDIGHCQYPIPDMGAPSLELADKICAEIDKLIIGGHRVAVHCRAGMGRTGTILTAYLIWQGNDAITALETARNIEPRWVQSDQQVNFLEQYELHLSESNSREAASV